MTAGEAVEIGGTSYRARDLRSTDVPAQVVTEKARSWIRVGTGTKATVRSANEPAPTLHFGARLNGVAWEKDTFPPTTVRVQPAEAALLQSFPADFVWKGTRTKQFQQIGNAVPPLLAEALLREVT